MRCVPCCRARAPWRRATSPGWRVGGGGCPAGGTRRRRRSRSARGAVLERLAQPPVGGVDAQAAARLGIDEGQLADVDEGLLARVGDLDGEDRVAPGDVGQRRGASRAAPRKSETMATRPAVVREAATVRSAVGDRRRRRRPPRAARRRSEPEQAEHPVAAAGRRADHGGLPASPKAMTPSRSERRATKRPMTRAAPSATSALRRSAVPKCIDAERSRSSQAVSWRSGTSSRTCGTPLRAVAFQSMRRTSSPGSYGRMRSSSRPAPRPSPRWSPTSRAPERRGQGDLQAPDEVVGDRAGTRSGRGPLATGEPGEVAAAPRVGRGSGRRSCRGRGLGREVELRGGHEAEDAGDDGVRRDAVGQGGVGQDEAVAQDVRGELGDVRRQDVAAAAQDGQGARAVDEVDRAARAGAVRRRSPRAPGRPSR